MNKKFTKEQITKFKSKSKLNKSKNNSEKIIPRSSENLKIKKIKNKKTKKNSESFRLCSKKLFLTYSPCTLSTKEAFEQLNIILNNNIIDYVITREKSQKDDDYHLHCFLKLLKQCDIKNATSLDLSKDGITFHGNYQGVKSEKDTINYILKTINSKLDSNNIIFSKSYDLMIDNSGILLNLYESMIRLAEKNRIGEAMSLFREKDPSGFLRTHMKTEKSLQQIFLRSEGFIPKFNLSQFIKEDLKPKIDLILEQKKTVYFLGTSGIGKTQFVLAYAKDKGFNPLIINNLDSLREFNSLIHDSIIFDDICLRNISRESLIKLFDIEVSVTIKVRYDNIRIPANTYRFFISNVSLSFYFNEKEYPEILRRYELIDLGSVMLFKSKD